MAGGYTLSRGRGPGGAMVNTWRLDGVEKVTANINTVLKKMQGKSALGLIHAARLVLNDADSGTSPLVPQDTGNLRASRFIGPKQWEARVNNQTAGVMGGAEGAEATLDNPNAKDPSVTFGYGANYAAAVHEMLTSPSGAPINWTRPGSGAKFLEASLKRNADLIVSTVAKYARK